jgi:hypothetical protein
VVDLIDKRGLVLMLHEVHGVLGCHWPLLVYSDAEVPILMWCSFKILLVDALVHALQLVVRFA